MNSLWSEAVEGWLTHLRAGGAPPTTMRLRTQHVSQLGRWAGERDPWALSTQDLATFVASQGWAPATVYAARSSLRGFFSWLQAAGYADANPALGLPPVRRSPPRPHPLSDEALAEVMLRVDERARLILLLAGRCGLRRGEVARVRGADVVGGPEAWSLLVQGKGSRERMVPMPDELAAAVRARGQGWTFPGSDNGHLSPDWIGRMISEALPAGWSLHSLRHRFATRAYAATGDLLSVQRLLGHSSPAVTQVYVQLPDDALRRAMLAAA